MHSRVIEKTFEWDLRSSPNELWPILSDTSRLNEMLNLPLYRINETIDRDDIRRRYGELEEDGVLTRWEELPFEWVQGRWWRWRRFHESGPMSETSGTLMLSPTPAGGTRVSYTLGAEPTGAMGRMLIATGHLRAAASAYEAIARKADAYCQKPVGDFFSNLAATRAGRVKPIEIPCVTKSESDAALVAQLGAWLPVAPFADVAHLQPFRLSRALGVGLGEAIRACLLGVEGGILALSYDATCPVCQVGAARFDRMQDIPEWIDCMHCGASYQRDLGKGIEAFFVVNPDIRPDPGGVYCATGPASASHVVLKQSVDAMERREVDRVLEAGTYRMRAEDGPVTREFELNAGSGLSIELTEDGVTVTTKAGEDGIVFANRCNRTYTMSLEHCVWPEERLTAAAFVTNQAVRETAVEERLAEGESAPAGYGTVVVIASPVLSASEMLSIATLRNGALYAADEAAWSLIFPSAADAVEAADDLLTAFPDAGIGLDFGPLTAASIEGAFTYTGTVPETARSLALSTTFGSIRRSARVEQALKG